MELRHLRYFRAVAESQSFTRAARHLHVSQSALSGQVRDLEQELGVVLLRRNHHEVALTPAGAIFLCEAREILAHSERAADMALRASKGQLGDLTIGLCGPSTAPFLPRLIRQFRGAHADVSISLRDITAEYQTEALRAGEIDIGFTRTVRTEYQKLLASEVLFREPILAVLPKGHSLGGERVISLGDLSQEPFVLYFRDGAPEMFDTIIGLCKKQGFSPKIVDSPKLMQSVITLVEADEGVALLPASAQHLRADGVSFHKLQGQDCLIDLVVAWRRNEPCAMRDDFLNLLRKNRPAVEELLPTA